MAFRRLICLRARVFIFIRRINHINMLFADGVFCCYLMWVILFIVAG